MLNKGDYMGHPFRGNQWKSGRGGRLMESMPKAKSMKQKQKEIDDLSDDEYKRYESAPKGMSHDEAIAHAKKPVDFKAALAARKAAQAAAKANAPKAEGRERLGSMQMERKKLVSRLSSKQRDVFDRLDAKTPRTPPTRVASDVWTHPLLPDRAFKTSAIAKEAAEIARSLSLLKIAHNTPAY